MIDREKVIKEAEEILSYVLPDEKDTSGIMVKVGWIRDTIALLKEQDNEKKLIMKVIWETLHEGLSIDTVADQDWVYERIRHRIEDT